MHRLGSLFLALLLIVQIGQWSWVRGEVTVADCAPVALHHCCCGDPMTASSCGCVEAPEETPAPQLPASPPPVGRDLVPVLTTAVVIAEIPAPSPERHDSPRPFVSAQRLPALPVEHRVLHCAYLI